MVATKDAIWYLRKRYFITFLAFLGMFCMYFVKLNLSIAIVAFTSDKNITIGNQTYLQEAEFKWTPLQKGFILSLFACGSSLSLCTGLLTSKYRGSTIFGLGIGITAALTVFSPLLLRLNIYIFSVARILEGACEGFANASFVEVFAHWAPPSERTRLISYAHLGGAIAGGANYMLSGYLAYTFGWEAIFYISGGVTLLWCSIWFIFVSYDPSVDKYISEAERSYLTSEITQINKKKTKVPWKKMLTSKPLWAFVNENFSKSWIYSFIMSCLPLYIKDIHAGNIRDIGLISSVPSSCGFISEIPIAYFVDYLRTNNIIRIANVHRICLGFGQVMVAILLIITGLWMNFSGSIVTFTLIRICLAVAFTSYLVLPVDVFPAYSSTARGIAVTGNNIGSTMSATLMGYMVSNHTRSEWNSYFLVLSVLNVWSFIIFLKYGSGEPQSWAIGCMDEEVPEQQGKSDSTSKVTS